MSPARVVSVNLAAARVVQEKPRLLSAIDKLPRQGPVAVGDLGLQGDEVADVVNHGGSFRALHAMAAEDLEHWGRVLGSALRPGLLGENLTTQDIDLNQCVIGEEWLVGTARVTVSAPRVPGPTLWRWLAVQGLGDDDLPQRYLAHGRPGLYLTVLQRGHVAAGDPVNVTWTPDHGITVGTAHRALHHDPALLPLLLEIDGLPPDVYDYAQRYMDQTG